MAQITYVCSTGPALCSGGAGWGSVLYDGELEAGGQASSCGCAIWWSLQTRAMVWPGICRATYRTWQAEHTQTRIMGRGPEERQKDHGIYSCFRLTWIILNPKNGNWTLPYSMCPIHFCPIELVTLNSSIYSQSAHLWWTGLSQSMLLKGPSRERFVCVCVCLIVRKKGDAVCVWRDQMPDCAYLYLTQEHTVKAAGCQVQCVHAVMSLLCLIICLTDRLSVCVCVCVSPLAQ